MQPCPLVATFSGHTDDGRNMTTTATAPRTTRSQTSLWPSSAARRSPRRARDARTDANPRGVRRLAAACGRADHRLASHDRADRGPDRDAGRRSAPRCGGPRATSSPPRTMPRRRSPPLGRRCSRGRARRSRSTGGARSRRSTGPTATGPNMILDDGGDATLLGPQGRRVRAGGRRPRPGLGGVRGAPGDLARP